MAVVSDWELIEQRLMTNGTLVRRPSEWQSVWGAALINELQMTKTINFFLLI